MSVETTANSENVARQRVAAEVLELGEALFDAVIETAARKPPVDGEDEMFPEADVRAAASEFFTALRLLLEVESV